MSETLTIALFTDEETTTEVTVTRPKITRDLAKHAAFAVTAIHNNTTEPRPF